MLFLLRSKKNFFPLGLTLSLVLLVVLSLWLVFSSYFQPLGESWSHVREHLLLPMLIDTLSLLVLNLLGCFLLGVSLAWMVCRYEFYGRRWLQWMLVLPLSIPPYVTAFILFDVFDSSGNLNYQLEQYLDVQLSLDLQYIGYASMTMVLVFYPYVYWLVRSSLLSMQGNLVDGANNLGLSEFALFWRVILPLARPAVVGGLSLVMLETLADFGAVSVFNINTLTTLIYKTWFSFFDLHTALQLSGLLLLVVGIFYGFNYLFRGRGLLYNPRQGKGLPRVSLHGWRAGLISGFCFGVLVLAFIMPIVALLMMVSAYFNEIDWSELLQVFYNTLIIGGGASVLLVSVSFLLVISLHQLRHDSSCNSHHKTALWMDKLITILRLGYALPGSVIAISLISALVYIETYMRLLGWETILSGGSLLLLFWAYAIRFFTVSLNTLEGSISRLNGNLLAIASNLGLSKWQVKRRVYMPNLKIPIMSALVLVFIEVIKEMPATLMLRPSEWETFSVNIYSYTSEGEWASAAMPALAMVMLCVFFMVVVFRIR